MRPIPLALALAFSVSGCGMLADAISDATAQEVETDLLPPMELGGELQQPIVFQASADEENPTYSLPADVDTSEWGPTIAAHNAAVEFGYGDLFAIEVSSASIESDGPVYFTVEVYSRDDLVLDGDGTIDEVDECFFSIDPTTNADLGVELTGCLTAWVAENGIPNELGYDVTISSTAGRADGEISVSHEEKVTALNNLETEDFTRRLKISNEILDNLGNLALEELAIASSGKWLPNTEEEPDEDCKPLPGTDLFVFGQATISGPNGSTSARMMGWLAEGVEYRFDHAAGKTTDEFQLPLSVDPLGFTGVHLTPDDPGEFLRQTLANALAAQSDSEDALPVKGFYRVAGHCPRDGFIKFRASGLAKFSTDPGTSLAPQ